MTKFMFASRSLQRKESFRLKRKLLVSTRRSALKGSRKMCFIENVKWKKSFEMIKIKFYPKKESNYIKSFLLESKGRRRRKDGIFIIF